MKRINLLVYLISLLSLSHVTIKTTSGKSLNELIQPRNTYTYSLANSCLAIVWLLYGYALPACMWPCYQLLKVTHDCLPCNHHQFIKKEKKQTLLTLSLFLGLTRGVETNLRSYRPPNIFNMVNHRPP